MQRILPIEKGEKVTFFTLSLAGEASNRPFGDTDIYPRAFEEYYELIQA